MNNIEINIKKIRSNGRSKKQNLNRKKLRYQTFSSS